MTRRVASLAICETDVIEGAETCVRVGVSTRNHPGRVAPSVRWRQREPDASDNSRRPRCWSSAGAIVRSRSWGIALARRRPGAIEPSPMRSPDSEATIGESDGRVGVVRLFGARFEV
jgi:hypothetical protein